MNNEILKQQLRDLCIAADGLATAMHLFYANVSSDILDYIIEQAEKENEHHHCGQDVHEEEGVSHRKVDTPCGPVRLINVEEEELGMPPKSIRELIGMRVVGAYPSNSKCCDCFFQIKPDGRPCQYKKVELVGGCYLCLKPIQPDEDKQEQEEEPSNIMSEIKEEVDKFMDSIDRMLNSNGNQTNSRT